MIRRPPRSTLFPYTNALPISKVCKLGGAGGFACRANFSHLLSEGTGAGETVPDRKSTRLNSSHSQISYAVFCLKKKNKMVELRHKAVEKALRSRIGHARPTHT